MCLGFWGWGNSFLYSGLGNCNLSFAFCPETTHYSFLPHHNGIGHTLGTGIHCFSIFCYTMFPQTQIVFIFMLASFGSTIIYICYCIIPNTLKMPRVLQWFIVLIKLSYRIKLFIGISGVSLLSANLMALGHGEGAGGTQERSPARGKFSETGSKGGPFEVFSANFKGWRWTVLKLSLLATFWQQTGWKPKT